MQYYVNFAENGNILGFYVDTINTNIPADAVPITHEQWEAYSADARLYKHDGVTIRLKTQQELDDEAAVQEPPQKTPDQLRIEDLEAQLSVLNTNNIEFMEMILQTLGVE